ncbi:hypothetical protein EI94DRAFT_1696058 [Lactarius quietus]|nr:hypothetical protein EI94DRAFT_1696058 [Lactarius quietus]
MSLSLALGSALPKPKLRIQVNYSLVPFWEKEEFTHTLKDTKKGETDVDIAHISAEPTARQGCPSNDDTLDDSKSNIFLHNADGTRISKSSLRYLSEQARRIWISLEKKGMVLKTFTQMTKPAWDYYAWSLLNDPKLDFLLLCNDSEWKLKLRSIKAYSCWSGNHGVRNKKAKDDKESGNVDLKILKDETLIHMDLEDEPKASDTPSTSHTPDEDVHGDGINDKVPEPPTICRSEIEDPFTSTVSTAMSSTPQGTTDKGLTPPPLDSAARSAEHLPRGQVDAHPSPQNDSTTAPPETTLHATTMSPQAIATTTPSGTCGDGNTSTISPTTSSLGPKACNAAVPLPLGTIPQDNLHIERAKVALNKKRKFVNKTESTAPKRQKLSGPAVPTQGNSIRNICMRHWNKLVTK